jgi:hypothetical protein
MANSNFLKSIVLNNNYKNCVSTFKMRCFGIMGGHENFAFNFVVNLSLVYVCFSKFEVINSVNV